MEKRPKEDQRKGKGPASVRMRGITKQFGDLVANDHVDLDLQPGSVHAVLGENGAGKSTLMNILSGVLSPDAGTIEVEGETVELTSPKRALQLGIGMVHQHFKLIDGLTVSENVHAGWEQTPTVFGRGATLDDQTRSLAERYGISVQPDATVWQLSVGEKQRVEILRTLTRGAGVLILDEPTASLVPAETGALFELIATLKGEGKAVVFISHKFQEVLAIADTISVMRAGKVVRTLGVKDASPKLLTELVVGGEVNPVKRQAGKPGVEVIALREGSAQNDLSLPALKGVDLTVRAGEIVGIAGVAGNGQRELAEVLTGCRELTAGTISVVGEDLTGAHPGRFVDAGVGSVPEDRLDTGLAKTETLWRNAILKTYAKPPVARNGWLVNRAIARERAEELLGEAGLEAKSVDDPAGSLSGGQAQRLLVGREMEIGERALVLAYPTRGLDVRAVETLHAAILAARGKGLAVLLFSEDLDELAVLADRTVVIYEGEFVGEFDKFDRDSIGALMGGMRPGETGKKK
jgi:general nucleoside transport system ATP-binding protein